MPLFLVNTIGHLQKKGIQECRRTPELADNLAIQKLWTDFNPKLIKKRCTYRKNL